MKTRNVTLTLTTVGVVLTLAAAPVRAQLPPSPADGQPSSPSAVRPTAPPRGAPPPPPDRRTPPVAPPRAAPRTPAVPPMAPPPPPPPGVEPTPPKSPLARPQDKIFGTRGVLEIGGTFDFSIQRDLENEATWLHLGLDAYVGYFVVKYFTLGMYLSLSFTQNETAGTKSWSVVPGVLLAPGTAVKIVRRVFFYGDVLGGLFGRRAVIEGYAASRDKEIYGSIGAEAGIKVRLTGRLLLRLGVRFLYNVGKRSSEQTTTIDGKVSLVDTTFRFGLSGFL